MAMSTDKKLYVALGVLAALGAAAYFQKQQQREEAASYTAEGRARDLPKIEITEEATKKINKITIQQPATGDAGKAKAVTLVKNGDKWQLTEPTQAEANESNVTSLLNNLKTLKVTEQITPASDAYAKYDLGEDKALHATFYEGDKAVADLYFGQSGSRGQMTRIAGHDGVYALKGYSSFLYTRDVKDWRDRTVFKFEEDKVNAIDITNEHGSFAFAKEGDKWKAKFKQPKAAAFAPLKDFDETKAKDMIQAYKGLNADGFNDSGKKPADVGLEQPLATVVFTLADGGKRTIRFGANAEGSSRWAVTEGNPEIISIGSWSADWAFAEPSKFAKAEDKKPDDKKDDPTAAIGGEDVDHGH